MSRTARLRAPPRVIACVATAMAAMFLLAGPSLPIVLWDESRTIVNALEMRRLSLVTTFGGAPDLWNTKPPLLIWAMRTSVDLLGPTLWALRLPSLLAALGTVALVAAFTRRLAGSPAAALLAAALLVLSPGFGGEHAARTADYDAPLTFFTTAYLLSLFAILHRTRPPRRLLVAASVAVAAALLTKGVAALVPGLGILAYAAATGRLTRTLRAPGAASAAVVAVSPLVLFAVLRERAAPGWLAAAWGNDVAGRLTTSLIGTPKPPTFYLDLLLHGWCAAAPLLLLAPVALALARGRRRFALLFAVLVATGILAVVSAAGSKLSHYALPALPFLAIAAALTAQIIVAAARRRSPVAAVLALLVVAVPVAVGAINGFRGRFAPPAPRAGTGEAASRYGALLTRLVAPDARIVVVDPGFALEGRPGYTPVLDAYRLLWSARGITIGRADAPETVPAGAVVASCDPVTARLLARGGRDVAHVAGCAAIRR